jgi:aminoglycoside phosphotransferase (APT) family kinase protein
LKELIVEAMGTDGTAGSDSTPARSRLDIAVARAADGLAALHGCDASADVTVTWDDECADVRQTLERLGATVPSLEPSVEPLLVELAARAGATPADAIGPAHGSFRPAQVLLSGADASIIDFDGFCLAEPALDIALFRCTLRDIALGELADGPGSPPDERALEQRADQTDVLCDHFLERYESHRPVSHTRVALYEALDLVTVVLRSWTKVKPARLRHGLVLLERHLEQLALG